MEIQFSHIVLGLFILCVLLMIDNTLTNISNNYSQDSLCKKEEKFSNTSENIPKVRLYHAPWCGFSKQVYPIFDKLEKEYFNKIEVERIDCQKDELKCGKEHIRGFPTIQINKNNKLDDTFIEYNGERSVQSILAACDINI